MDINNNIKELEECVLFGFPFNSEQKEVFNFINKILHLCRKIERKKQT